MAGKQDTPRRSSFRTAPGKTEQCAAGASPTGRRHSVRVTSSRPRAGDEEAGPDGRGHSGPTVLPQPSAGGLGRARGRVSFIFTRLLLFFCTSLAFNETTFLKKPSGVEAGFGEQLAEWTGSGWE